MNKVSEAQSAYLKDLEAASVKLEKSTVEEMGAKGKNYQAGSTTTSVTEKFVSMDVGADGKAATVDGTSKQVNNTGLAAMIKSLETDMETVRNKREEFQTMFENFDQKSNQLFNMLSTVLKNVKEMQSSVTRNLL